MNASASPTPTRALRVAMVWGGSVHGETLLREPAPVVLGYGEQALFPLPEGPASRGDLTLLTPTEGGYHLHLPPDARGAVWLGGQRREVRDLLHTAPTLLVSEQDHGVISLGPVSYFFQSVRPARDPAPSPAWLDGDTGASLGLSLFLHVVVMLLMLMAYREMPPDTSLELPPDLIASFVATPPPEPLPPAPDAGDETDDPGLRERDEGGGQRRARDEGRAGMKQAKQERSEVEGESRGEVVARVRGVGVLGALSGGNALANALDAPSVADVLSGLGSVRTVTGRGSGGSGLRGIGKGGGGDRAQGKLFAGGKLGTGIGRGKGGGGRGKSGPGAQGRRRKEAKVSVKTGRAKVNGFLSQEQINRVVRAHQAALRYCYENEVQRQRGLRGRIQVQWRINLSGRVSSARVASSSLRNARVEGCVVRQIRKWRFPKPDGGEVHVLYPFIFGVGA